MVEEEVDPVVEEEVDPEVEDGSVPLHDLDIPITFPVKIHKRKRNEERGWSAEALFPFVWFVF